MLRPVVIGLLGLATAACGFVESDPNRFEKLALQVAEIPLDGQPVPARSAPAAGLRPALVTPEQVVAPGALRVEVMDPHALWDARDAGLRGAVERVGPAVLEAAAPVVSGAIAHKTADGVTVHRPGTSTQTLQLGAFSSLEAAREAWGRLAQAGDALATLQPAYEAVTVDGRTLTRVKVVAEPSLAQRVCRAADSVQLGCLRRD